MNDSMPCFCFKNVVSFKTDFMVSNQSIRIESISRGGFKNILQVSRKILMSFFEKS